MDLRKLKKLIDLVQESGIAELGNSAGALPFTVLLDRAGRVAQRRLGAYKDGELRQALLPLLG